MKTNNIDWALLINWIEGINLILWVERIRIFFNFLAGFLLAPEIIGERRILAAQKSIIHRITNLEKKFRNSKKDFKFGVFDINPSRNDIDSFSFFLILCLSLLIGFHVFAIYKLLTLGVFIYIVIAYVVNLIPAVVITVKSIVYLQTVKEIHTFALWPFIFIGIYITAPLFEIYILLTQIIIVVYRYVLIMLGLILRLFYKRVTQKDSLRNFLIFLGVILFIIANIVEFITTFIE